MGGCPPDQAAVDESVLSLILLSCCFLKTTWQLLRGFWRPETPGISLESESYGNQVVNGWREWGLCCGSAPLLLCTNSKVFLDVVQNSHRKVESLNFYLSNLLTLEQKSVVCPRPGITERIKKPAFGDGSWNGTGFKKVICRPQNNSIITSCQ